MSEKFDLTPIPTTAAETEVADTEPRYETANRSQLELAPCDLEALLPPDHWGRLVWRFVEGLDLTRFYDAIRAREGGPGRPAIDPKILIALCLCATIDGVGSARELDRLCQYHDLYRGIRGGVSVNYHTLSDFRIAQHAALDDLLTQSIAALLHRGVVTLARVAHEGTRVRASAGAGSFRRGPTLRECLQTARKQVERTARQEDGAVGARQQAAQQRAAEERLARVEEALQALPEVEAVKARGKRKTEPRVSTTDPDARVMKMADGGFRPAYNAQFATDVDSRLIVGVRVTNVGSDRGELVPMVEEIHRRTGRLPQAHLVDGGFVNKAAITALTTRGITLDAPAAEATGSRDLAQPCRGDPPAVAAWRARMVTDEAKALSKQRGSTAEWLHADLRTHRTLAQIPVRGLQKVHTWLLWAALAHNLLRALHVVPHLMT